MGDEKHITAAYQLRSGLMIYPSQAAVIEKTLAELVDKMPARFALLTDNSGLVIDFQGEQGTLDLVTLGSLAAGDLAASQAIGQLVGEYADYQMIVREGRTHNMFLNEAGHELVLLVQVSAEVPLGWARMLVLDAVKQLDKIVASVPLEVLLAPEEPLNPIELRDPIGLSPAEDQSVGLIESTLGDLFGQALDDMWNQD